MAPVRGAATAGQAGPHVPFDFRASDVLTAQDDIGFLCPRCVAATTRRDERGWRRVSPRP